MLCWKRFIFTQARPARSKVHHTVMTTLRATHRSHITDPMCTCVYMCVTGSQSVISFLYFLAIFSFLVTYFFIHISFFHTRFHHYDSHPSISLRQSFISVIYISHLQLLYIHHLIKFYSFTISSFFCCIIFLVGSL